MSLGLGDGSYERASSQANVNKLAARADADRTARLAGHKSPFRRLLERLRPHRQQQSGDPPSDYGTTADPRH